jgi:hypothetical protein
MHDVKLQVIEKDGLFYLRKEVDTGGKVYRKFSIGYHDIDSLLQCTDSVCYEAP